MRVNIYSEFHYSIPEYLSEYLSCYFFCLLGNIRVGYQKSSFNTNIAKSLHDDTTFFSLSFGNIDSASQDMKDFFFLFCAVSTISHYVSLSVRQRTGSTSQGEGLKYETQIEFA